MNWWWVAPALLCIHFIIQYPVNFKTGLFLRSASCAIMFSPWQVPNHFKIWCQYLGQKVEMLLCLATEFCFSFPVLILWSYCQVWAWTLWDKNSAIRNPPTYLPMNHVNHLLMPHPLQSSLHLKGLFHLTVQRLGHTKLTPRASSSGKTKLQTNVLYVLCLREKK